MNFFLLAVVALTGLLWSSASQAQSCDFIATGPTTATVPAGGSQNFSFYFGDACSFTFSTTQTILANTTGAGASVTPPAFAAVPQDATYTFTATAGATPGGTMTVRVTCTVGTCTGQTLDYTLNTANQFTYIADGPTAITTNQITPYTIGTDLTVNGTDGTVPTTFTNVTNATTLGTVTPTAGIATYSGSFATAGTYNLRGTLNCPVAVPLAGCTAVPPVNFNVVVEPVSVTAITPNTITVNSGASTPLTIRYGSASIPAPSGTPITWTVSGPSMSDGAVTSPPVGAAGQSTATFTATVPGTYSVFANSGCTFCAPGQQIFTINVVTVPTLAVTGGNGQNALVNTAFAAPLQVNAANSGNPAGGVGITWAVTSGSATITPGGPTNGTGTATATVVAGPTAGPVTITATRVDAPTVTATFNLTVNPLGTLAITGGNGQNAVINAAFASPLQVTATDGGGPTAGVGITWAVTSGSATVTPGGATSAAGTASATVTAGPTPGPVTITATRQDQPVSATFNLTVSALGSLTITGGNSQQLQPNVASAPLQVRLDNAAGVPVAGATVSWTATAGTLASATSVTNAQGIASNTVTSSTPGQVQVTATSPLAAGNAVFTLKGALAGLPGMDPTQAAVATAVDAACPALAALPTPTPAQADLLARCIELTNAGGLDPAATIGALDQLMADVALTQANAALTAAQSQFQNLKTRIAALRSGTGGTSFGGLSLNTPTGPISLGMLAQAFSNSADEPQGEIGGDFSRWGFFAAGTIGRGEAEAGRRDPAYDYDIEGLTFGADYRKNDRWIFGASLGLTRQDTDLPGTRGGLETTGWSVSGYTTFYRADSWYMDGVATWGRNDYDMVRNIRYTIPLLGGGTRTIDQTARSDSKGDLLSTAFTFGRDFNRGALGIGPYARLLYTRVGFDTIDERMDVGDGSGLGLQIRNRDITSLASVIGSKFTYTWSTDWGVLMPHAQLEWEHEFKDDPQAIEARFLNDPTGTAMVVRGDPLDTDYFRLGLGMSMVLANGRSGFVYYERLVGRNGMSQYNLALGLRLEF